MTKVNLTYFKPSGKYYTSGAYNSEFTLGIYIYKEIEFWSNKVDLGPLPGLSSQYWDGYILVEPEDGVPAIVNFCDDSNS